MGKKEIDVQTEGIRSAKDLSPRAAEGKGISGHQCGALREEKSWASSGRPCRSGEGISTSTKSSREPSEQGS